MVVGVCVGCVVGLADGCLDKVHVGEVVESGDGFTVGPLVGINEGSFTRFTHAGAGPLKVFVSFKATHWG